MKGFLKRLFLLMVSAVLVIQLVSCGTLLYPEREGQRSGTLDITVVLLDGAGLLFFLIPGIVAFAVDFHTGAIYLPPGHPRSKSKRIIHENYKKPYVVQVDPEKLNQETIEAIVSNEMGFPVRLNDSRIVVEKAKNDVKVLNKLHKLSLLESN